jgi:hypothetical protein
VSSDAEPGQIDLSNDESGVSIVHGFTKGALSGVELFRFRNEDADVRVVLDGRDVFRTPSEELLERLEEQGHRVEQNDDGVDTLPDLKVISSNESSFEYPMDEDGSGDGDGDPIFFDYALVTSVDFPAPRGD